jgi:hypothetical protein
MQGNGLPLVAAPSRCSCTRGQHKADAVLSSSEVAGGDLLALIALDVVENLLAQRFERRLDEGANQCATIKAQQANNADHQ